MKIGFYNYYKYYNNNRMFSSSNSPIGDELSYPTFYLGAFLRKVGYEISTIDIGDIDSYDIIIFIDLPSKNDQLFKHLQKINHKRLYLLIFESPLIRSENWEIKNHIFFKKVYTWNDQFVDSIKYFKFFLPNKLHSHLELNRQTKKLCTIIAGNKLVSDKKDELYSERNKAIRWYEANHPTDFDLYGVGWDDGEPRKYLKHVILFNKITCKLYYKIKTDSFLKKLILPFHIKYPSYRGRIDSKNETLKNYKFSICYENATNISGYITEKIFDCFFAGCIPIYLGAPDIKNFVPQSTFVDKRDFKTYEDLYIYLNTMPDSIYNEYIHEIKKYLQSEDIKKFSAEYFTEIIYKNIILDK